MLIEDGSRANLNSEGLPSLYEEENIVEELGSIRPVSPPSQTSLLNDYKDYEDYEDYEESILKGVRDNLNTRIEDNISSRRYGDY